jgi:hypothetical protein
LKNPVTLAERARVRAEKPAILTVAEAPALIENAEADFIPAFALGLFAGLRPESEVWPLDWNQIDFKDKTVDVNQSKNLAGERFVKMSENLIEWLRPQAFPLLLGAWRTIAGDEAIHRIRKDQACWSAAGAKVGLLHRFIVGTFGLEVSFIQLSHTVLGLFALVPTNSKAQDFSISFGGVPGFYGPGYYSGGDCDPGHGYYFYHRRVYYRPAYYPGYYYGGYYRRHHRCHHWEDDD